MIAPSSPESLTRLLERVRRGDSEASDRLYALVYDQLHRLARQVRYGRAGETLRTTALVHETYLKLCASDALDVTGRVHFFRTAARAMRQVLTDAARRRLAHKRGGDRFQVTFDDSVRAAPAGAARLLELDRAIDRLAAIDPRAAQVVESRFFGGLGVEETALALDVSPRTVKRDWRVARAFLAAELQETDG